MKKMRKALSLLLAVVLLTSGMVFAMPSTATAAEYPSGLYNGTQPVSYTAADALNGKYLVEIDAIKYHPNIAQDPQPIRSEAGDVIITYKPNNGTAPEATKRYEDVITANAFNYTGEGIFTFYAVLEGFPQKATISAKKTNPADNESGIYAGIKVWNVEIGAFENVYDFSKIERSNGISTSDLMFTNIAPLLQYYPYAKQGSASGSNLTLPTGLNATTAVQTFSVTDQWGVTMIAPNIDYTPVTGLTFSQDKNVMTLKGTGDANTPNGSSRSVSLTATYATENTSVSNSFSVTKNVTVYNSSTLTYAPTFDNREVAGLNVSFKTSSSSSIEKFELNASYRMTTTNYVVIKNNASRKASINIATGSSDKIRINPAIDTIEAGATKTYQIIDLQTATANYSADITVEYTLEGLYDAATGTLAKLSAASTIPFIYNKLTTPFLNVYDKPWNQRFVNVDVTMIGNSGVIYNQTSSASADGDKYTGWVIDCYVDRDLYSTYNAAGMGFKFTSNYDNHYQFNNEDGYAGSYVQNPSYNSVGTFGFTSDAGAHTSLYKEVLSGDNCEIGSGSGATKNQYFYGTIFTGSTTTNDPAQLYFQQMQIHCPDWIGNSAYFTLSLNIYALSKANLRSQVKTCKGYNYLSCYFNSAKWSAYTSMDSSAMKTALIELGTDMTNQKAVTGAYSSLYTANNNLRSGAANGTYSLIHNKHVGDISTAIEATAVDFYVFETGSSNALKFKQEYADSCNKHSDAYMPTMVSSGTFEHTFDYWTIDFSGLNALLATYEEVAPEGQFINVDEAVGSELFTARSIDTSSTTANPSTQSEVDIAVNALANAMRNLKYKSYNMRLYHKMLNPAGTAEIDNDYIHNYTESYNKTATYGEVVDGTADLHDGTYTVKGVHFDPQPDSNFVTYSSRYYYQGISSEYLCAEDKDITIIYYAKSITDSELSDMIDNVEDTVDDWDGVYTDISIDGFVDWFDVKYDSGALTKIFSIFDVDEYNALVAEFKAELAKLDPIATQEQLEEVESFIANYETLQDFGGAFCNAEVLLANYEAAYNSANELMELSNEDNAGKNAANSLLSSVENFQLMQHEEGAHQLLNAPKDSIDGSYFILCSNCGEIVDSGVFTSPHFNQYKNEVYDYSHRGAALRIKGEKLTNDYQDIRFAASCLVPDGADVTDFGFVYTQTKYLNGGIEPTDNTPVNVNQLVEDGLYVTKFSMFSGQYTVHASEEGDVYTFNLVLKLRKNNWDTHYAARSYITYSLNGVEVTVYDASYASRTARYVAQCVAQSPYESPSTRAYVTEKFGL
ncbi:MAG: hypothetical protein IJJ41_06695 [Clostridia bacterium]|nr:hypothetical protein [Clostridia bacterium]